MIKRAGEASERSQPRVQPSVSNKTPSGVAKGTQFNTTTTNTTNPSPNPTISTDGTTNYYGISPTLNYDSWLHNRSDPEISMKYPGVGVLKVDAFNKKYEKPLGLEYKEASRTYANNLSNAKTAENWYKDTTAETVKTPLAAPYTSSWLRWSHGDLPNDPQYDSARAQADKYRASLGLGTIATGKLYKDAKTFGQPLSNSQALNAFKPYGFGVGVNDLTGLPPNVPRWTTNVNVTDNIPSAISSQFKNYGIDYDSNAGRHLDISQQVSDATGMKNIWHDPDMPK
jgi:hypothetical protein